MKNLCYLYILFIAFSCDYREINEPSKVMGYKPIYIVAADFRKVESIAPRKLQKPGKIYIKDKYLYINEIGEGIHVFDNSDKTKPLPVSFISIPANQDISISGNTLYADNADELVAIDITNPKAIVLKKRVEKAFPYPSYPIERGKFECVDPKLGFVKRWEYTELINPKCSR